MLHDKDLPFIQDSIHIVSNIHETGGTMFTMCIDATNGELIVGCSICIFDLRMRNESINRKHAKRVMVNRDARKGASAQADTGMRQPTQCALQP